MRGPGETQLETDRRLLGQRVKVPRQAAGAHPGAARNRAPHAHADTGADPGAGGLHQCRQINPVPHADGLSRVCRRRWWVTPNAGKSTLFRTLTGSLPRMSQISCSPRSIRPSGVSGCPAARLPWWRTPSVSSVTCRTTWLPRSARPSPRRARRRCCCTSSMPAIRAAANAWSRSIKCCARSAPGRFRRSSCITRSTGCRWAPRLERDADGRGGVGVDLGGAGRRHRSARAGHYRAHFAHRAAGAGASPAQRRGSCVRVCTPAASSSKRAISTTARSSCCSNWLMWICSSWRARPVSW